MLGRMILPFAVGFALGGIAVSFLDQRRRDLQRQAPGVWVGHVHDVDAQFIDDPELQ